MTTINTTTDTKSYVDNLIATSRRIVILAGEGEVLNRHEYTGKRTLRAIKMALTKERCGGDRIVKCLIYSHMVGELDVYFDVEAMTYC